MQQIRQRQHMNTYTRIRMYVVHAHQTQHNRRLKMHLKRKIVPVVHERFISFVSISHINQHILEIKNT